MLCGGARAGSSSAIDALTRALELTPGNAHLCLARGRCQLRLNAAGLALPDFDRAVAIAPTLAQAWSERASLLGELHRLDEAAIGSGFFIVTCPSIYSGALPR